MAHHSNGLCSFPRREGVGGEATVNQAQVRNEAGILNVQVIFRDLFGGKLSLVGDGLGG